MVDFAADVAADVAVDGAVVIVDTVAAAETGAAVEIAWVVCLGPAAAVVSEPESLTLEWRVERSTKLTHVSYARYCEKWSSTRRVWNIRIKATVNLHTCYALSVLTMYDLHPEFFIIISGL